MICTIERLLFTGGLGNVHRGGSETPRNATECVHEAFGFPYQLQNSTAYNETCATFYGAYYSWRLFMLTGNPMYLMLWRKRSITTCRPWGLTERVISIRTCCVGMVSSIRYCRWIFIRDGLKNALAFVVLQAWCVSWLKQKRLCLCER